MTGVLDRLGAANPGTLGLRSGGTQSGALPAPDARSAAREIEDVADGGSDALVDAIGAGRDVFAVAEREALR